MDAMELIRDVHEHRVWTHHRLMEAAESLTEEQLRRSFPIGRGSIWKSLLHLYAADWGWLEVLHGDPSPTLQGDVSHKLPGNQEGRGAIRSLGELKEKWQELDRRWAVYLDQLDDSTLDQLIHSESDSTPEGILHAARLADVVLHLSTYTQYTTGEIHYMLHQLDAKEKLDAMLITWARARQRA